jgi:DNA-binding MarR family transcriptional regulator
MQTLARRKQWTIGEIASTLEISSAAATKNVDRLQLRGLVIRVKDLMDRRVINVHLTPAGLEVLQKQQVLIRRL